jgi:outer membrane receptor protein involved in Fe transport
VNAFTGRSRTWIADATLKWSPHGNPTHRALKVQGEYMQRTEDGDLTFDTLGADLLGSYHNRQSGWYLQSVYQFIPRWRIGARYDSLDAGGASIGLVESGTLLPGDFPLLLAASPDRFSLMLDWSPSEFSRLRAQYAWDQARAEGIEDHQLFLQYLYSIGAHGAHKF